MTFTALLLSLYVLLLVLAAASAGWAAHLRAATSEAQRVTDAVERAGLSQLASSLPSAGVGLALMLALSVVLAPDEGAAAYLFPLGPAAGALIAALVTLATTRRLVRASGQLVGATTGDILTSVSEMAAMAVCLVAAGSAGLLVTAVDLLGSHFVAPRSGPVMALLAGGTATLILTLFGRALAVAWGSAEEGNEEAEADLPLGASTLARLVGRSFGVCVLRTAALFAVVSLGQSALAFGSLRSDAPDPSLFQYAQLLPPLGLLAALFGALASRSSEREPVSWAWVRGGGVSLVVTLAGIWALAGMLGEHDLARLSAAICSFAALGVAVATTVTLMGRPSSPSTTGAGQLASDKNAVSPFLGLGFLVLTPILSLFALPAGVQLPPSTHQALLLGSLLALVPSFIRWQLATDTLDASRLCHLLANEGHGRFSPRTSGPPPSVNVVCTVLLPLVGILSFDLVYEPTSEPPTFALWLVGVGILLGVLSTLQTTSINRSGSQWGARALAPLTSSAQADALPPLAAGLDVVRRAGAQRQWLWLLALLAPISLLSLLGRWGSGTLTALIAGYVLGVVSTATLLSLGLVNPSAPSNRPHASLAVPAALAILGWASALLLTLP